MTKKTMITKSAALGLPLLWHINAYAHPEHDLASKSLWIEDGVGHLFTHSDHLLSLVVLGIAITVPSLVKWIKDRKRGATLRDERLH